MAAGALAKYFKLSGTLFRQFQREKKLVCNHWLDTNLDKYYETMNEIAIQDCVDTVSKLPGFPDRIQKLLSSTIPAYHDAWNFSVEILYRMVADQSHQTEENMRKTYILRAVMEMLFNLQAVLDDFIDKSDRRIGKKASLFEETPGFATYDGALMLIYPMHVLKKHFRNDHGYKNMFNAIMTGGLDVMVGQSVNGLGLAPDSTSLTEFGPCRNYKAGKLLKIGATLGLIHAGIFNDELIFKTEEIFNRAGKMLQVWDDFNDFFCSKEKTRKPSSDIETGAENWVSSTAMKKFTDSQAREFKECYGSTEPTKIERVHELYKEIDMSTLYVKFIIDNYNLSKAEIKEIPHPKIQEACNSYLEWLAGHEILP